ncbi:MAG: NAD-dependent deacylase [Chloroflexi bacterium CFX1]|nr:NAD-dependent deacylase [Chloroflexi bacterium CFX1]MCQ3953084.1 RNA polymerase subunit sigma [Chloroflexota bacterium]MDL1919299.1 NAD-dependent deacylase [Chloroflexi bacterium CFX5]NUQ59075.1 NAD-dependent deacylase [Anaerolineales bacterium]
MNSFSAQSRAKIEFVADLIRNSKHTVVLTGAGISTPSGIPDFRSTGTGLWSRDEPLEVASLSTFRTKPGQFFEWFRPLARQMFEAKPNAAHAALAEMEMRGFIKAVITQNIDALHQKSGSQIVIETHGTMRTLTCTQCYHQAQAGAHIERFVETGELPRCPRCAQLLKPDVILFGEQLPQAAWFAAQKEARACDLMLVAGSSLEVLPVAGLPMQALDRGAHLVVVNNTPTYINVRADAAILEDVAAVLPAIAERVLNG